MTNRSCQFGVIFLAAYQSFFELLELAYNAYMSSVKYLLGVLLNLSCGIKDLIKNNYQIFFYIVGISGI